MINEDIKKIKLAYRKGQYRISGGLYSELEYQTYASKESARIEE